MTTAEDLEAIRAALDLAYTWSAPKRPGQITVFNGYTALGRLRKLRKRTLEEAAVEADQLAEEAAWSDLLDQLKGHNMPHVLQRVISAGAARKIAKRIRALLEPKP